MSYNKLTRMPLSQLARLSPQFALEKALMQHGTRLNHNFWGYHFSPTYAADSPTPNSQWEPRLKVNFWTRKIVSEYDLFETPAELAKSSETQSPQLMYRSGSNIFYNDVTELTDVILKEILSDYYRFFLKQKISTCLQKYYGSTVIVNDVSYDAVLNLLWNNSTQIEAVIESLCRNEQHVIEIGAAAAQNVSKEDLEEIVKEYDKMRGNQKALNDKNNAQLLTLLNEKMALEGIDKGWTTQRTIDQVECRHTKTVWTVVLLISDLTFYNAIDQLDFKPAPELVPFLQLILSVGFTAYYLSRWYESRQIEQYKKRHLNKPGLDAASDFDAIRQEAHVLAAQSALLALCANLLMNDELWKTPEANVVLGTVAAVLLGCALMLTTYCINRVYAQQNRFTWKQYAGVFALALVAGAGFSAATLFSGVADVFSAETVSLNTERALVLFFGGGLFYISKTASVSAPQPGDKKNVLS